MVDLEFRITSGLKSGEIPRNEAAIVRECDNYCGWLESSSLTQQIKNRVANFPTAIRPNESIDDYTERMNTVKDAAQISSTDALEQEFLNQEITARIAWLAKRNIIARRDG